MKYNVFILIFSFLFIVSCDITQYFPQNQTPIDQGPELKTIFWDLTTDGYAQFYTNESRYLGIDGWTFWTWGTYQDVTMNYVETTVKKVSGDSQMGYGVLFCVQDTDNFLFLSIDSEGYYMMGKYVAGSFSMVQDWTFSLDLVTGYNVDNILKVTFDSPKSYIVNINGVDQITVTDNNAPTYSGGYYGYIVSIDSDEDFPDVAVDVRLKQVFPVE